MVKKNLTNLIGIWSFPIAFDLISFRVLITMSTVTLLIEKELSWYCTFVGLSVYPTSSPILVKCSLRRVELTVPLILTVFFYPSSLIFLHRVLLLRLGENWTL